MQTKARTSTKRITPTTENGTVPRRRARNAARRPREYLTAAEVNQLMAAARDATLILLAYRHGLRAGELVSVRWDQLDFSQGLFHVRRLKNGRPSVHLLRGSELRALRRRPCA